MTIILDESMGMVAGMGLANFDKVIVVARVSASGQVTPSAGDYEARSGELDLNSEASSIDLNISKRI
jgi:cytochrome c-type biogenesis protein CcmH